jgi:hypothetical protein
MPDIYDDMEDGEAQRAYNKERLAELKATEPERRKRMARMLNVEHKFSCDATLYRDGECNCGLSR